MLLTACIIVFFWIFVKPPQFTNTNDDAMMSAFAYGYMGERTAYLAYINLLVGYGLYVLLTLFPRVPWYFLAQLAVVYISSSVVCYLILDRFRGKRAIFPVVFFFLVFGYNLFSDMQFTKTSAIATIAGIMLLYYGITERRHWTTDGLACLLILLGSLYRFKAFLMVTALLGVPGILIVFENIKGKDWRGVLRISIPFVCILGLCLGCYAFSEYKYYQSPGWRYFKEVNPLRDTLQNSMLEGKTNGYPDYEENRALYESLGITEEDLALYISTNYGDPEFLNIETLQKLVDARPEKTVSLSFFKDMIRRLYDGFCDYSLFPALCLAFLFGIWCFVSKRRWKSLIIVLYELAVFGALQAYFYYRGRYLLNRVDIPLFMTMTLLLLLAAWDEESDLLDRKNVSLMLAFALLAIHLPIFHSYHEERVKQKELGEAQANIRSLMSQDAEHFYFYYYSWEGFPDRVFDVWHVEEVGSRKNTACLGTWRSTTPNVIDKLSRYDIWNPFSEMVDSDTIYLMCMTDQQLKRVLTHIQQHYCATATANLVKVVDGAYRIYQITSGAPSLDTTEATNAASGLYFDVQVDDGAGPNVTVTGTLYEDGVSSYRSRVYLGVIDGHGDETIYYAVQSESEGIEEDEHGRYGAFTSSFRLPEEEEDVQYVAYLENDSGFYRIPIETAAE